MKHMKKRIIACLLAGLMSVSSLSVISPSVSAAGLGYWPEPLPMGNQWYYQNEIAHARLRGRPHPQHEHTERF